jgi:hypothetical protein
MSPEARRPVATGPSPDDVAPAEDVGAETAERYAYQHRYAAVIACGLLDEDSGITEVFCEHHEDILVKTASARYRGIQVKTREPGLEQWKTGSLEIRKSLARFACLERDFGEHFDAYTVATDHQFFRGKKNGSNLLHVLETAKSCATKTAPKALRPLIKQVAHDAECSQQVAFRTLQKTRCDDSLPKKAEIRRHLMQAVCETWPKAADVAYRRVPALADGLANAVYAASSLQHKQSLLLYLGVVADTPPEGGADTLTATVEGKRLSREKVAALLNELLDAPELIHFDGIAPPRALKQHNSPMLLKLTAGDFTAVGIANARDLAAAALNQHLQWAEKYGQAEALRRYHHISAIVQNEATQVYEEAVSKKNALGVLMLKELRARLESRRDKEGAGLFGCTDEHLLGYAFMLTDYCKIWWSPVFSIEQAS